jgi:outer membrane lipoprotein LolB
VNPTYLLLILTLVSACSLQPQPTETINSWQQQQRVAKLQDWTLSGKLGFRAPQQGGSAALNWIQKKDNYQLFLSGPFGVGSAKIYCNDDSAEML